MMMHAQENLFFGRLPDGSVRILKLSAPPIQGDWPIVDQRYHSVMVECDLTLTAEAWASVVGSVSQLGEADGRFYAALSFHNTRS